MTPSPQSKSQINRAGEVLRATYRRRISPDDRQKRARGLMVAEEYRLQHAYPLKLVTAGLSSMAKSEFADAAVGQRLKRMPAIVHKLRRYDKMQLARMQDIGGCRAVLADAAQVEGVLRRIRKQRWNVVRISDYREEPRAETGYRGLHVIVARLPPRWEQPYDVEVQLRTAGQHRWAESVEQWAAYTREPLKDGKGPADLVEYFRLASDFVHFRTSGQPLPPGLEARALEAERQIRARYLDESR